MKTFLLTIATVLILSLSFNACRTKKTAETKPTEKSKAEQRENIIQEAGSFLDSEGEFPVKNGLKLGYFQNSPDFPNAELELFIPILKKVGEGRVNFKYKVKNFELTKTTEGATSCGCANSDKGQHIHQIINNDPYIARYQDTFSQVLAQGHYINLTFLSRSYHESVKGKKAYQLNQFNVGNANDADVDLSGPLLFYSRPKGEYKGAETKNVLLDFYLVNTTLSEKGNRVKATINGNEFTLNQWRAYSLQGLPMGKNTIKLELVDKDGKLIPGPYNSVTRTITLKEN